MKTFRGVFPALVAPQDDNDRVLFDAMGQLAQRHIKAGAGGFLVNGHTGELGLLSGNERREALTTVRAAVGSDVPIIAGVHTQGLGRKFASQAESAAECGADAILMFSPFSFARGARVTVNKKSACAGLDMALSKFAHCVEKNFIVVVLRRNERRKDSSERLHLDHLQTY